MKKKNIWGVAALALACLGLYFVFGDVASDVSGKLGLRADAAGEISSARMRSIPSSSNYDIAGSFTKTDFSYKADGNGVFGNVAETNKTYYAFLDGATDDTFTASNVYCGWDRQNHDYPDGWHMEREFIASDKYKILVNGRSKADCGLGQPQNTGWFKLNPDSGWKITDAVRCNVATDSDSNGVTIETYCTVDKVTGEVRWQSGSACNGCCACGDGAPVDIELVVEKFVPSLSTTVIANANSSIDQGAKNVQLIAVKLTNTGTEDLSLSEIHIMGDFKASDVVNPALYVGGTRLGSPSAKRDDAVTFSGLNLTIAEGGSIVLFVRGDITDTNITINMNYYVEVSTLYDTIVARGAISGNKAAFHIDSTYSPIYVQWEEPPVAEENVPPVVCQPYDGSIKDGFMIRAKNGIDVYIVKFVGCKKFKRLILSPSVFESYGHLRWEDVINVEPAVLDRYVTSSYVYVSGENKIWRLEPNGDTGIKREFEGYNDPQWAFDADGLYEINAVDRDSYVTGAKIYSL